MTRPQSDAGTTAVLFTDDFTRIKGIGRAINQDLHQAGIETFGQLAASSPEWLATVIARRSAKRITRERWISQARRLTPHPPKDKARRRAAQGVPSQHYETFAVELLLDADNYLRRTRIIHVQSGVEESWAGWADARLIGFIAAHAALPSQSDEALSSSRSTVNTAQTVTPLPEGKLKVREAYIIPLGADEPSSTIEQGQPFQVQLCIELSGVLTKDSEAFDFIATLYARALGAGTRQILGEVRGTLADTHRIVITVEGTHLPQGVYVLKAVVVMPAMDNLLSQASLVAVKQIGLLQIW